MRWLRQLWHRLTYRRAMRRKYERYLIATGSTRDEAQQLTRELGW